MKSSKTQVIDKPITEEDEALNLSSHDPSPDPMPNDASTQVVKRRSKLPAPIPDMADFSLLSLLRKNIGKETKAPPSMLH